MLPLCNDNTDRFYLMWLYRLTNRGLYPLAIEICSYLKVTPVEGKVKVLRQWAMRKVKGVQPCRSKSVHVVTFYLIVAVLGFSGSG